MKYAIISLQGKQYRVEEKQLLTVDHLAGEVGTTIEPEVLLYNDGQVQVGQPTVAKVKVTLKVVEQGKDAKLRVFKYKSKSKYHKTIGHRQQITNLEVVSIA